MLGAGRTSLSKENSGGSEIEVRALHKVGELCVLSYVWSLC